MRLLHCLLASSLASAQRCIALLVRLALWPVVFICRAESAADLATLSGPQLQSDRPPLPDNFYSTKLKPAFNLPPHPLPYTTLCRGAFPESTCKRKLHFKSTTWFLYSQSRTNRRRQPTTLKHFIYHHLTPFLSAAMTSSAFPNGNGQTSLKTTELDNIWDDLREGIEQVFRHKNQNMSKMRYMELYT